jgi:hypothetical protein
VTLLVNAVDCKNNAWNEQYEIIKNVYKVVAAELLLQLIFGMLSSEEHFNV